MAIKKAIRKYGKENFTIELIEEVETDKLDEREVYWISFYNSYNDGYNCSEDNLIMLTEMQHGTIHKNEMKE